MPPVPPRKKKAKKRPFLLLEVLIAFLLVVMCAIPLISPHVTIYKDQIAFIDKIELDHAINEEYAKIIEQLHRQAIPWDSIANGVKFPIEKDSLKASDGRPLPFEGSYQFSLTKKKPEKEEKPFMVYLFKLTYTLKPQQKSDGKNLVYEYDIFIPRQLSGETPEKEEKKEDKGGKA